MAEAFDPERIELTEPAGWQEGTSRRFVAIIGSRAGGQILGMIWFFAAGRLLSDAEFGVLATGLSFFAVFAGLGDVGMTRTIVRHVAADHRMLWPAYWRAVLWRIAGGLVVGGVTLAVLAAFHVDISLAAVAIAALLATVSGITELGFGALRSIGAVRVEVILVVAERALFLVIAVPLVASGGGAIAALLVFLGTNAISAVLAFGFVLAHRSPEQVDPGPILDLEARFTAAEFALAVVSPRISPVLLSVLASSVAVGVFVAGQRPIEAMTIFALSATTPVLPIVRGKLVAGKEAEASHAAIAVVTAISIGMTPALVWFVVNPTMVLTLFYGADRYPGAEVVLRLIALTGLTWSLRGLGEYVLLAEERARACFYMAAAGTAVNIVLGVPLIRASGSSGAAVAVVVSELVMTVVLIRLLPKLADRQALVRYAPVLGLGLLAAALYAVARGSLLASGVILVGLTAIGALHALRSLRRLDAVT